MTLDELLLDAPKALDELTLELFSRADVAIHLNAKSQLSACLQVALRSASIMSGMARVLDLATLDSFEVLNRAAIEAKDLLMYFRFEESGIRDRVSHWFAGHRDQAWKADHIKVESFLAKHGANRMQLGASWQKLSALSHPTKYAADNSCVIIESRITGLLNGLSISQKRADFVVGISRLIIAVTYDLPGWLPLGLNEANMPIVQLFSQNAEAIAAPIVNCHSR
jgi:hypothetical protein